VPAWVRQARRFGSVDFAAASAEAESFVKPVSQIVLKRKGLGAVVGVVGFLLSPLSWWNDLLVNVPLALGFAWVVSCIHRGAFTASFVLGYWLTNVAGLVLLHRSAEAVFGSGIKPYGRRQVARDLVIALLYTAVIVLLVQANLLGPLPIPGSR
jgi:hypothetical protein